MKNIVKIKIAGVEREILSYDKALQMEQGFVGNEYRTLTQFQYQSILFNNLGLKSCPKDLSWIDKGISIEDLVSNNMLTEILDYPITRHKMMIINNIDLYSLLQVIALWIHGNTERGVLVNKKKSFKLPDAKQIEFCLKEGIIIKRSVELEEDTSYWNTADILTRRRYNLNPYVNKYYAKYCIHKFEEYAKQIVVIDPFAMFVSALIDPDIIMSSIRNAEIQAAREVSEKSISGYAALRMDYEVAVRFTELFRAKMIHISNIFRTKGPTGFLVEKINRERNMNIITKEEAQKMYAALEINGPGSEDQISIELRKKEIKNLVITPEIKKYIYTFLDKKSLPPVVSEVVKDSQGKQTFSDLYYPTLRRLYSVMKEIENNRPEVMDTKDKLIMSYPFYIDPNRFALYSKVTNIFYTVNENLEIYELSPKQAVEFYRERYGKKVQLDIDELGENANSIECPDISVEELDKESKKPDAILETQPAINTVTQPPVQNTGYKIEDGQYGIDINSLVM